MFKDGVDRATVEVPPCRGGSGEPRSNYFIPFGRPGGKRRKILQVPKKKKKKKRKVEILGKCEVLCCMIYGQWTCTLLLTITLRCTPLVAPHITHAPS